MTHQRLLNLSAFALLACIVLVGPTVLAQATGVMTGGAPKPTDTNEWGSSVVFAFLSSTALEWIKRNRMLTIFSERTAFLAQRFVGIALAIGTGAGIHASFEGATGVLTVSGLLWPSVWDAGRESLRQWVFQELTYRTAVKDYGKETN